MASLTPITGQLGERNAAHLLRRATFGPTRTEIEHFATLSVGAALNELLANLAKPAPPVDSNTGLSWLPKPDPAVNSDDTALFNQFRAWFIELMRTTGPNLRERMTFFYHSHLPADYNVISQAPSLYYQNALYRNYALGNYKKLLTKACLDNAMLVYIDNTLNDIDSPNENFAREMFELYTIGKGEQIGLEDYTNYTETDIKRAARVLTGFKHDFDFTAIDAETGLPRGKATLEGTKAIRHDPKDKIFTDKFQNTVVTPKANLMSGTFASEEGAIDEISQMIDMIFAKVETAKFLCRKLYRFFVYYQITTEIENDIIAPLATTFVSNNFEIVPVLRQLLSSEHFYDMDNASTSDNIIGALIKSPLDLTVGMFRFFGIDLPVDVKKLYDLAYGSILPDLDLQGMGFYTPIDVAGYPPYHQEPVYNRNWITPNYIARRYQFGATLVKGVVDQSSNILFKLDIVKYVDNIAHISDPGNPRTLVTELTKYLFTNDIPVDRYNYFLNDILLENLMEAHWTEEWTKYKGSGDDTVVRSQLEKLIISIFQSPEYQLF